MPDTPTSLPLRSAMPLISPFCVLATASPNPGRRVLEKT